LPTKALQLGETFAAFVKRAILNRHDGNTPDNRLDDD
jgi:hypothetical protein